jgi:hypothetical protein
MFGVGNVLYVCPQCGGSYYADDESSPGTAFKPERRTWDKHNCGFWRKVWEFFKPTSCGFLGGIFDR